MAKQPEIGHNFGLYNCSTPRCLMGSANGSIKTVDEEKKALCDKCRRNPLVRNAPALKNE